MKRWTSRQVIAFVLGVFVILGMGLHGFQTSMMAAQMATAVEAGASGMGQCDKCGSEGDADVITCTSLLNCSSMAAVLPSAHGFLAGEAGSLIIPMSGPARDLTASPDPHPPRSLELG